MWGRGIGWPRLKVLQVPDEGVLPNEHLCGYVVYDGYTMMSLEGLCVSIQDVFSLQDGTLRRGEVRTPEWQFKSIQELAIEVFLFKRNFFGLAFPGNHLACIIAGLSIRSLWACQ